MAICVCLLIIGVIGGNIVMNFVLGTNSWSSRHDDTILTFLIAKDYPFWGIGIATDPIEIWDIYYNRYSALRLYTGYQKAMSCGLGNYMCMAGIPFTVLYLVALVKCLQGCLKKTVFIKVNYSCLDSNVFIRRTIVAYAILLYGNFYNGCMENETKF